MHDSCTYRHSTSQFLAPKTRVSHHVKPGFLGLTAVWVTTVFEFRLVGLGFPTRVSPNPTSNNVLWIIIWIPDWHKIWKTHNSQSYSTISQKLSTRKNYNRISSHLDKPACLSTDRFTSRIAQDPWLG